MSQLLSLLLFRKTSGKTTNTVYIKKAPAKSHLIFKPKMFGLSSHDWFPYWTTHRYLYPGVPGSQRRQCNPPPTLFCEISPQQTFYLPENKFGAGWPLVVPRQLQDEHGGVSKPSSKTSLLLLFCGYRSL